MDIVLISGGVGGARLARGFAAIAGTVRTTVVVNVADDDVIYGVHVSPDVDTVLYTVAGVQGEHGWGRAEETWSVMDELARFPIDTRFRLGDRDLALNLYRTARLQQGAALSTVVDELTAAFGVPLRLLPATDDRVRTMVGLAGSDEWLDFQTYFVLRRHSDPIDRIRFDGIDDARPAPGVIEAISAAHAVVVAPSNPVLSVWPIIELPGVADALRAAKRVVAVSPLVGGKAVKGPAAEVLEALGHTADTRGVASAYRGLLGGIVVDSGDREAAADLGIPVLATDTMMPDRSASERVAREVVAWLA